LKNSPKLAHLEDNPKYERLIRSCLLKNAGDERIIKSGSRTPELLFGWNL
jgi:hypothetical protein